MRIMYTQKTFTIVVERDPERDLLVGQVVELPECHSEAPDFPTLEAKMREAITAYFQAVYA